MKKFLNILFAFILMFAAMPAYCGTAEFYSIPINDEKTNVELARAVVPEYFDVTSSVLWSRDFENPVKLSFIATSMQDDVIFSYLSKSSYVDILNGEELKNDQYDKDFRTVNKKVTAPDEYIKSIILEEYAEATEITKFSEAKMPQGMDEYLVGLMYEKIDELNITAKADSRYSKIDISNPKIFPYIATFSYELNGKTYYQTFLTVFSSIEYQFTSKKKSDKNRLKDKIFWEMKGLYSYRVEQKNYDKYFEDFVIFVANSMPNNKAVSAVEHVKQQMVIELNPSYFDINKKSGLQNKPSELFGRYFELGLPDYSYVDTMIKPSLSQVRWLVNILEPQNEFSYRNVKQVWRQSFYVPEQYKYVYFNIKDDKWLISTEVKKLDRSWIKLKQTKFQNKKSD